MTTPNILHHTHNMSASPVAERDRIIVLDSLRGLAIFGIAVVNIQFFAFPLAEVGRWNWQQVSFPEGVVRSAIASLANDEFFSIFAILFGMGLALQSRHAQQTNRPFVGLHLRRLAVLLMFGLAHALFLWYGDILALYAAVAFVALWCRNLSGRILLIAAGILFFIPVALHLFIIFQGPHVDQQRNFWDQCRDTLQARTQEQPAGNLGHPSTSPAATQSIGSRAVADPDQTSAEHLLNLVNFLADEQRIYLTGTMNEKILHRSIIFFIGGSYIAATHMGWRALAMMFLGIYFVKRRWFDGSDQHANVYRRFLVIGVTCGVVLHGIGAILQITGLHTAWQNGLKIISHYLGSLPMCLAYMGALALLCQRPQWSRRLKPLAAVGRMALTNYIGQSFLFGCVFYGYGLGWFGQTGLLSAELVVLAVLLLQLFISTVWLRYVKYGPLEWLWRVCTYMRLLPILPSPTPNANPPSNNPSDTHP